MPRPPIEDFLPDRERATARDIGAALADLGATECWGGFTVPLPYTRREDGTVDTIEVGPYGGTGEWSVDLGRSYDYGGASSSFNIIAHVGRCPGHMVILVVRALYAYLTAVGPQGRADTAEGDVLYALGLVRDAAANV